MKSKIKSAASLEMGNFFSAISAPAKAMSMTNANISREFSVGPQPNTSAPGPNTSAAVPNMSTPNTPGTAATRRNRRQSGGKSRRRHRKSRTRRH